MGTQRKRVLEGPVWWRNWGNCSKMSRREAPPTRYRPGSMVFPLQGGWAWKSHQSGEQRGGGKKKDGISGTPASSLVCPCFPIAAGVFGQIALLQLTTLPSMTVSHPVSSSHGPHRALTPSCPCDVGPVCPS